MTDTTTGIQTPTGPVARKLRDNGDGTFSAGVDVSAVTAAPLTFGGSPHVSKTLGSANVDSAFDAVVPAGTRYVEIYCAAACIVAIGEATSATLGRFVPGGLPAIFRLSDADVASGKALHAQSATASAVVYAAYLAG